MITSANILTKFEEEYPLPRMYNEYTARDYFNLPEGSPYQLIEGELVMTPSPLTAHQIISRNLELMIFNHVKKHKLGIALDAPIDVYLDNKNAYQPDIIFVSDERKDIVKKMGIDGAPDLVIEILSSSTAAYDKGAKKAVYERSGVMEYIIVDPKTKSVHIYRRKKSSSKNFDEEATIRNKKGKSDGFVIKTLNLEIDLDEAFTEF